MNFGETADQVASAYNSWSEIYDSNENRTRDLAATELRRADLVLAGRDALEIGCGTGINTAYLADNCRSVTAVDFSDGMLENARKKLNAENLRFLQNDIRLKWAVEDSSADIILCTLVLEHLDDLSHVFDEARRVLRAGGKFLFYELHPFRQLRGGQAQFTDTASNEVVYVPAFLHSISEFVNSALAAGFNIVHLDETGDDRDKSENALPRLFSMLVRKG